MPTSHLLQLGLAACFVSSPPVAAAAGAAAGASPIHDVPAVVAVIGGETAPEGWRLEEALKIKYASGAARSRAGWTLGTEEESAEMRALFKVLVCSVHGCEGVLFTGAPCHTNSIVMTESSSSTTSAQQQQRSRNVFHPRLPVLVGHTRTILEYHIYTRSKTDCCGSWCFL